MGLGITGLITDLNLSEFFNDWSSWT